MRSGWLAAVGVTLLMAGLVAADLADSGVRRWWASHALTTDVVAGLLVLLVTVLVADQVVRARQIKDRSRAVAAQAAIIAGQAARAVTAVSAVLDGSGERDAATGAVQTYMIMLLVSGPVLIDARASRSFLEEAQRLGAVLARALGVVGTAGGSAEDAGAHLDEAVQRLRAAASPLLQVLSLPELTAAGASEPSGS
jgi:hypothetical protein